MSRNGSPGGFASTPYLVTRLTWPYRSVEYLRVEGPFEYPRWVATASLATLFPIGRAAIYAEAMKTPHDPSPSATLAEPILREDSAWVPPEPVPETKPERGFVRPPLEAAAAFGGIDLAIEGMD